MSSLYIFDFDDTLANTNSHVRVIRKNGAVDRLDSRQFASYRPIPGDELDFTEFTEASGTLIDDTVEELELIGPKTTPTTLLTRLFHEESPRVFNPQPVVFGCSCSEKKVRQSLSIYSAKDIETMTTEKGNVTADCQFCGAHYVLDAKTVGFDAANE